MKILIKLKKSILLCLFASGFVMFILGVMQNFSTEEAMYNQFRNSVAISFSFGIGYIIVKELIFRKSKIMHIEGTKEVVRQVSKNLNKRGEPNELREEEGRFYLLIDKDSSLTISQIENQKTKCHEKI